MRGSPVTVLANATELFSNIDASMPKFSDWLQQGMGINSSATLEVRASGHERPQLEVPVLQAATASHCPALHRMPHEHSDLTAAHAAHAAVLTYLHCLPPLSFT